MPARMKFWELVSAFREAPEPLREVLTSDRWGEPYGRWYAAFDRLVTEQDRSVLDAIVPLELSREVALRCPLAIFYVAALGVLRHVLPDGLDDKGQPLLELTALEVHDQYGGAIIEEILEYGSVAAGPPEDGRGRAVSPPRSRGTSKAPAAPWPTGYKAEIASARAAGDHEGVIRVLESRLVSHPSDWNAMHELSGALIAGGRPAEAVPLIIAVADFFARDGFFKHARGLVKMAAKLDPAHPDVCSRLEAWDGK